MVTTLCREPFAHSLFHLFTRNSFALVQLSQSHINLQLEIQLRSEPWQHEIRQVSELRDEGSDDTWSLHSHDPDASLHWNIFTLSLVAGCVNR